ncbi:MAG: adenosylcobinamide-GDP ribazoletransferase [Spirochaetales bacterium]|nr:adenosylcobinamide-GDP ribazoletransferase [Spirochaetales bacterium]
MKAWAEAMRFLTIIYIPGKPPKSASDAMAAYPWAGLTLGLLVALSAWGASWVFQPLTIAIIALTIKIGLTGGLHFDGLADLADGFGGGRDQERRLAIMADSRLGTFGALALLAMAALQGVFLYELMSIRYSQPLSPLFLIPLVLAPSFSRGLLPLFMRLFPSARPGGMGERSKNLANGKTILLALMAILVMAFCFSGFMGIVILFLSGGCMAYYGWKITKTLGGLTGDCYGALIEIGELTTFILFVLGQKMGVPILPFQGLIPLW